MKKLNKEISAVSSESDRERSLESALSALEKNFGKGTIMRLDQNKPLEQIESISTGSIGLDIAIGIGGIPK